VPGGNFSNNRVKEDARFTLWLGQNGYGKWVEKEKYAVGDIRNRRSLWAEVNKYHKQYTAPPPFVQAAGETAVSFCATMQIRCFLRNQVKLDVLSPLGALLKMNNNTSPGFPWRVKFQTKKDLVNDVTGSALLWDRVSDLSNKFSDDFGFKHCFYSFLKEELRPLEKLNSVPPKIRSISGAPVDMCIVGNTMCGMYNDAFYSCHNQAGFGSVVGVSPFHGGWDRLHAMHFRDPYYVRTFAVSLDVSQWDRSFSPYLFQCVLRIRKAVTDEVGTDELKRLVNSGLSALYRDVVNSLVAVPDSATTVLVEMLGGMKSGWINTTTDNTIGHYIVLVSLLAHHDALHTVGKEFMFSLYGDDNFSSWTALLRDLLTAPRLIAWYALWGFTLHEARVLEGEECNKLDFLGGRFGICKTTHTRVYVPADPQKAIDSMRFKFKNLDGAFERACALRCLHFYNPEVYEIATKYAQELFNMVIVGLQANYLSREAIMHVHTGFEGDGPLNFVLTIPDRLQQHLRDLFLERCPSQDGQYPDS